MRRSLQLVLGLTAALGLTAILLAVPAALILWQHDPLPHALPTLNDLETPLSMQAITKAISVLLWIAWLQFAVAVTAEMRYQWPLRHQRGVGQPARTRQLPLTGPSGSLAGRLVALALLLTAASTAILPNADAATAARSNSTPVRAHTVAIASAVATTAAARPESNATSTQTDTSAASSIPGIPVGAKYFTVVRFDSLWRIADECLGDGPRYDEIFQLNKGRIQPDGHVLTERSLIRPGWHLIMPTDAVHCETATATEALPSAQAQPAQYTVGSGDDLSSIAWKEYHDASDWTLIYHANQNEISNPNLIYPGQNLEVPGLPGQSAAPASASSATPEKPAPGSSGSTRQSSTPRASASAVGSTVSAPALQPPTTTSTTTASPSQTPATRTAPGQSGRSAAASPSPAHAAPSSPANASTQASAVPGERTLWELLGIGGLAAAAAVTTLDLRRRRQQRARREGEYIKMPQARPILTDFELILRSGNDTEAGAWMSRVMRAAAATAARSGADLPDLRLVSFGADALYVQPRRPSAPVAPFVAAEDWWVCPRETPLPAPEELVEVTAPYPALVTVGTDEHGRAVLLDLESIRALALPGPVGIGALRAIALELLGQIPAGKLSVTLVGVGIELTLADLPASLNLAIDLESAIDALEDAVTIAAGQLAASSANSVRGARLAGEADAPVTHIIISAEEPTPAQTERLARLLGAAPAMCAAVITGAPIPVGAPAWVLPATGEPEILAPTGIKILGQYLTDTAYAELIEHFRVSADLESTPTPGWITPSPGADEPNIGQGESEPATDAYDIGADPGEVLRTCPDDDLHEADLAEGDELEESDPEEPPVTAPQPASAPTRAGASGPFAPFPTTSPVHPRPGADKDSQAPRLLVLGQIQLVCARGGVEPSRASKLRELAAYLVLNDGASASELTEAVWPQGTTQKNRNTSANKLRSWLGRDEAGELYFPKAYGGYRLAPSVSCDLLDFRAHYTKGVQARSAGSDQEAAAAFEAGLALVRGRPFAGAEPRRYGWAEPELQRTVSEIVDAVRHLAAMRMAEGDWMAAATIAAWGMGIGPEHESLFRLRFEAIYRMGDQTELNRLSTVLQARLGEMGMDMQDETRDLLEELLGRRVAALRNVGSTDL